MAPYYVLLFLKLFCNNHWNDCHTLNFAITGENNLYYSYCNVLVLFSNSHYFSSFHCNYDKLRFLYAGGSHASKIECLYHCLFDIVLTIWSKQNDSYSYSTALIVINNSNNIIKSLYNMSLCDMLNVLIKPRLCTCNTSHTIVIKIECSQYSIFH